VTSPFDDVIGPADLGALRLRIETAGGDPAETPEDFVEVMADARHFVETGELPVRATSLRVQLFGQGARGHEITVQAATSVLSALQEAVTATGQQEALQPMHPDAQRSTSEATQLYLTPQITQGSVVFFLEGNDRLYPQQDVSLPSVESLVDIATRRLFSVLQLANTVDMDEIDERTRLKTVLHEQGYSTATWLLTLADASLNHGVELRLALRTPIGQRAHSALSLRGSTALQKAYSEVW
jgi:hypothetical protein